MSWKKNTTEKAGDGLRFAAYLFIALDAIVISAFTLWFVWNFTAKLMDWLDRVLFLRQW